MNLGMPASAPNTDKYVLRISHEHPCDDTEAEIRLSVVQLCMSWPFLQAKGPIVRSRVWHNNSLFSAQIDTS